MTTRWILALGLTMSVAACARGPQPEPIFVRASELGSLPPAETRADRPLVIEVREGDVIPLDVTIGGDYIASPPDASIPLVAKRTFFLRVAKEGLSISPDGKTFGEKPRVPGSFRMGVSATRERGLRGEIVIHTPQH